MRAFMKTFAVATLAALVLAACGTNDDPDTGTTPTEPAPPTNEVPDPDEPDETDGDTLAVFFVRSEPTRFFVEPEYQVSDTVDTSPIEAASEALTRLFAASDPNDPAAPADPDLFTSIPEGVTLNSATLDGDTVIVDVAGLHGTSGASAQETTLLLQIAHTATYAADATYVELLFDGESQSELYGHVDIDGPMEVSVFDLSPVTIVTPAYGATADVGEVTYAGEALVFEATVALTLTNTDTGATVYSGFTTATVGGPERGTWQWSHTFTEPGTYTLEAAETDPSDGEGRPVYVATRTITVG